MPGRCDGLYVARTRDLARRPRAFSRLRYICHAAGHGRKPAGVLRLGSRVSVDIVRLAAVWFGERRSSDAPAAPRRILFDGKRPIFRPAGVAAKPRRGRFSAPRRRTCLRCVLWMRQRNRSPGQSAPQLLSSRQSLSWSLVGLGYSIHPMLEPPAQFHTALVCLAAVVLAWFGSRWNLDELIWLLYPWMIFGMFKLVAEDLRRGDRRYFTVLLIYGGTLIVLPRLVGAPDRCSLVLSLKL